MPDEFDQTRLLQSRNSNRYQGRMAAAFRVSKTQESSENKDRECDLGNQVISNSTQKPQSLEIPPLAWEKNLVTVIEETSTKKEISTPKEDYTRHAVTVEVCQEPHVKPLKQEVA